MMRATPPAARPLPCPCCGKPAHAWRVQLVDGAFWACGCRPHTTMEAPCTRTFTGDGADEAEATRNWNAAVLEMRARIDGMVGYVTPLDYAWARRRRRARR